MEKIVVTTDFSANSKTGIRYAINLARARHAELIILHVFTVLRASSWSDQKYEQYVQYNRDILMKDLKSFIRTIFRSMDITFNDYQLVLHHDFDIVDGIMEYAKENSCTYICISTRGAGPVKKLFGTNTGKLLMQSNIPVLCIPSSCRMKTIKDILYLTDMTDYERELSNVVAFAAPLKSTVSMLHFAHSYEFLPDKEIMEQTLKKKVDYDIYVQNRKRSTENSLLEDVNTAIKTLKPSLLVMFTHQDKSFFERLLLSSNAKAYSFYGKIPLLSFKKMK